MLYTIGSTNFFRISNRFDTTRHERTPPLIL